MFDTILSFDSSVLLWLSALPHPAWLTWAMKTLSAVSAWSTIWYLIALGLVLRGHPEAGFRAAMALVITALVVGVVLKPVVDRERPPTPLGSALAATESASFPSGHAAGAAAGAYGLSRVSLTGAPVLWSLATLVAISRLYLGAHYPLDVLSGLLIGLLCAHVVTISRRQAGHGPP